MHSGLSDFYPSDRFSKLCSWIKSMMPSFEWGPLDYYYYYKPTGSIKDMLAHRCDIPFESQNLMFHAAPMADDAIEGEHPAISVED